MPGGPSWCPQRADSIEQRLFRHGHSLGHACQNTLCFRLAVNTSSVAAVWCLTLVRLSLRGWVRTLCALTYGSVACMYMLARTGRTGPWQVRCFQAKPVYLDMFSNLWCLENLL
jgi:hypothetical protein